MDKIMKTKGLQANHLYNHANQYVRFYEYLAELKNLYRQGWVRRRGVPDEQAESVGDHIFSTALLALVVIMNERKDLDVTTVVFMILIHDLAEAICGDFIPTDMMSAEEKHRREAAAVQKIFGQLQEGQYFVDLWHAYEAQETPEARFAKDCDKLDAVLMAYAYDGNTINDDAFGDFAEGAKKHVTSKEAKDILAALT